MKQNPPRLSHRVRWTLLLLLAGPALAQDDWQGFPPARVEVAIAVTREMAPMVELPGTVVSLNDSRIAAEVEGVVAWLAEVGTAVDAGDVVARIDPELNRIALSRATANHARLQADFEYREKQLERAEELATTNSISKTLLDETRAQRAQAEHALADAQAALDFARSNLRRTEIRAAFSGHVSERFASVGEYLGVGENVLRLVDTHRMEVALPAPIAIARYVRPGMAVSVRNDGIELQHEVRTVVPVGDAVSRMVEVRLTVADGDWLVGTPVQVLLPSDEPVTTVAVPRDALVERSGQTYVYRLSDDGSAQQVLIDINTIVGLWVGINGGVAAGDQVVVRGAERLAPGQQVEVIEAMGSN